MFKTYTNYNLHFNLQFTLHYLITLVIRELNNNEHVHAIST